MIEHANKTELLEAVKEKTGLTPRVDLSEERLVQLVYNPSSMVPEEVADINKTRAKLEAWITNNWDWVNGQIPCTGELRGKCTKYPCSNGRHMDCYIGAKKVMV